MRKRIVSILAVVMILSFMAFVPTTSAQSSTSAAIPTVDKTAPSSAGSSINVVKSGLDKLAPNLLSEIQANPSGEYRVEVVLKDGANKASALGCISSLGGLINGQHSIINSISATLTGDKISAVASLADVDKILVDGKKYLVPVPQSDDSGAAIQSFMNTYPDWYSQFPFWVGADKAWQMGINGEGVIVADLDTGIFIEHPDLAGVVIDYKVFTGEVDAFPHDGNGHGTATTSCVAAQGNVEWDLGVPDVYFKVQGVAPGVKVIGGKVLTDAGWGWDSWIIDGIEWAVQRGANIITMSLGGLEVPNNGYDPTALALDAATKLGVTCFVAAGNEQGLDTVGSPGVAKDVITVGASTENSFIYYWLGYWPTLPASGYENDQVIFWSSGGATADGRLDPDICAVGAWGLTLDSYPNYLWLQFGGTSMATPVAAGVGALVLQAYKQAHGAFPSPAMVRDILMNTAKDLGYPANRQGAGRVDAEKAVLAAMSQYPYSNRDEVNTGILSSGKCYTTTSVFTDSISCAYATTLQMFDSLSFSNLVIPRGYTYLSFQIPSGTDYADVRVKSAPEYAYGTSVHTYDGSTWTDAHLNTALYRNDSGNLILIDYAYAHTNVQWLDARVSPGDYVLLIWNQYKVTVSPVDVEANFYKFVNWDWVSTSSRGNCLFTTISVPTASAPGTYSGFVKVTSSGAQIDIPIVVTVPAKLGQTFSVQANVVNEPRTGSSGDWFYIPVQAFTIGTLTLTASWTSSDADFDAYLVNPAGAVKAMSVAPLVPVVLSGGGGQYWYTTTGSTMEVLSAFSLLPGYWYIGIHAIYFGNNFDQEVTVKLDQGSPIVAPSYLNLKAGTSKTFTISNKIAGAINVQTMALSFQTERFSQQLTSTVASFGDTGIGYDGWIIPVTPDITTLAVSINWVGSHGLTLILWDPAGRNAGLTATSGQTLTINNPAIGWWTAIITINDAGSQYYTLNVGGTHFKPLEGVTVQPAAFTLAAKGNQALTITVAPKVRGMGQLICYDFTSGSIYSITLLTITSTCGWTNC
ncbi:MAG: S8 family serine peptidase [Promethearchaeati archaeon SRVP18_Atabeyarchaeia-1]